jgi:hypothetical protein
MFENWTIAQILWSNIGSPRNKVVIWFKQSQTWGIKK